MNKFGEVYLRIGFLDRFAPITDLECKNDQIDF